MKQLPMFGAIGLIAILSSVADVRAFPASQGTSFAYQGRLISGGTPITGDVDLQFRLFDASSGGTQIGSTLALNTVDVDEGIFSASLDFGTAPQAFNGEARWLEIAVASPANGGAGPFTTLAPRQRIESSPYAIYALNAALGGSYANAVNFSNAANAFVGDGSGLLNLNASSIASGVIANASTTGTASSAADTLVLRDGGGGFSAGAITATSFAGDGSGLTNLNASNIASGTLADARLSALLMARIPQSLGLTASITDTFVVDQIPISIAMNAGHAFVVSNVDSTLTSISLADPSALVEADVLPIGSSLTYVAINGSTAWVTSAADDRLYSVNISDPTNLTLTTSIVTDDFPVFVAVRSNRAYVACPGATNSLQVFDITNPAAPALLGSVVVGGGPRWIDFVGDVAYVSCTSSSEIKAFNVSNPASMTLLGTVSTATSPLPIRIQGSTAYVGSTLGDSLQSFNVANPASMTLLDTLALGASAYDILLVGDAALVAQNDANNVRIIDISDPADLQSQSVFATQLSPRALASNGNLGCVTTNFGTHSVQPFTLGGLNFGGNIVQAAAFQGSGAGLTNLNASSITAGTLGATALAGSYTNAVTFTSISNTFVGNGAGLTSLNASNISTGNLAAARLPTGGSWPLSSSLLIDGGVLTVDPANNRVGIGVGSPAVPLQLNSTADAGTTLGTGAFNIVNGVNGLIFDSNEIQSIGGTLAINSNSEQNVSLGGDAIIVTTGDLVGINRTPVANDFEVGGAASKAVSGSWLANSDRRIKTDIQTVSNALDTIDRVRLTSFRYTPAYLRSHPEIEDRAYLNVIAQEFAQVFPEHVKGSGEFLANGSEILQVDTHPLTIYSAAAIQELRADAARKTAEIASLREENQLRRAEIAELRALVEQLAAQQNRREN